MKYFSKLWTITHEFSDDLDHSFKWWTISHEFWYYFLENYEHVDFVMIWALYLKLRTITVYFYDIFLLWNIFIK